MSSTKRQRLEKALRDLERQRTRILSDLLATRAILRGSYARIYTKCGKDNCWCKEGKGHPHSRITWSEDGQGFTRKVPSDQVDWVREMTESYRTFRALRRELASLEKQGKRLLDAWEDHLVKTTRSNTDFLKAHGGNRKRERGNVSKRKKRRNRKRR
jgi:hypothetical protein